MTSQTAGRRPASHGTLRGALWVLYLGAVYYLMSNPIALMGDFGKSLQIVIWGSAAFLLVQVRWLRAPRPSWPLVLFLAYALLSWFWSISPSATLHAVQFYVVLGVLAAVVAANVDVTTLAHGLASGGLVVLAASLYAAYENIPGVRIPAGGDGWLAGVGTNANILGYSLVPALAAVLAVLPRTRWGWVPWSATASALAIGVVLAYSGTAMLAAVTVTVVALIMHSIRWFSRLGRGWLKASILTPVLLALPTYLLVNAVLLGRDVATLDGRVVVWQAAIETSRPALWTGNGWGAVWQHIWLVAPANPVVDRIYVRTGIVFSHGHNSFIDPLPELGLIGVALLVWCHLWAGYRAISAVLSKQSTLEDRARGRLVLCLLTALLVLGVSEPMSVIPLGWCLLVIALTGAARPLGPPRFRGQSRPKGRRRATPADVGPAAATPLA